jgi:hypothetical protein
MPTIPATQEVEVGGSRSKVICNKVGIRKKNNLKQKVQAVEDLRKYNILFSPLCYQKKKKKTG